MKLALYIGAVVYAFIKWGIGWGIVNIFIPFSLIWDIIKYAINTL